MISLFFTGVILWLIYGLMTENFPIILANGLPLVLAGSLLWFKLVYKEQAFFNI